MYVVDSGSRDSSHGIPLLRKPGPHLKNPLRKQLFSVLLSGCLCVKALVSEGYVDYLVEAWGMRSAPEGSVRALPWRGRRDTISRVYTGSLEKMGAAESGEGTLLS